MLCKVISSILPNWHECRHCSWSPLTGNIVKWTALISSSLRCQCFSWNCMSINNHEKPNVYRFVTQRDSVNQPPPPCNAHLQPQLKCNSILELIFYYQSYNNNELVYQYGALAPNTPWSILALASSVVYLVWFVIMEWREELILAEQCWAWLAELLCWWFEQWLLVAKY